MSRSYERVRRRSIVSQRIYSPRPFAHAPDTYVVLFAKSTLTVNAVFIASSLLFDSTINGSSNASARASSRDTHTNPDVCRIINAMDSAVILS